MTGMGHHLGKKEDIVDDMKDSFAVTKEILIGL